MAKVTRLFHLRNPQLSVTTSRQIWLYLNRIWNKAFYYLYYSVWTKLINVANCRTRGLLLDNE